jgi:hypothetical protein
MQIMVFVPIFANATCSGGQMQPNELQTNYQTGRFYILHIHLIQINGLQQVHVLLTPLISFYTPRSTMGQIVCVLSVFLSSAKNFNLGCNF